LFRTIVSKIRLSQSVLQPSVAHPASRSIFAGILRPRVNLRPPPPACRDSRYWRISLCNASSSNRNIQLSSAIRVTTRSSSACKCIPGAIFSGCSEREREREREREGEREEVERRRRGGPSSVSSVAIVRNSAARLTPREITSRESDYSRGRSLPPSPSPSPLPRPSRPSRPPSFARLSLIEIQDAPFAKRTPRFRVLNHVS